MNASGKLNNHYGCLRLKLSNKMALAACWNFSILYAVEGDIDQ